MNTTVIIYEFIKYLAIGLWTGFVAFFEALPIYETLSGFKEEIIAVALGIPTIIITIVFAIPSIIKLAIKIADQFL